MKKRKIKILRIIARLNIGGPAIHTILLTQKLNDSRYTSLLVKGQEDQYEGDMNYLADEKQIDPIVISELGRAISWKDDLKAFWKTYKLIQAEKPDIVHTHTAKAGAIGRIAAKAAGVPVIIHTFHGHVFHSYFSKWQTKVFIWIERFLASFTDRIITVSRKQRREILEYGIGNPDKVITVPLGLDLEKVVNGKSYTGAFRKQFKIPEECPTVGIVARLVPIKGHTYFLSAARKVLDEVPQARFLVVGDGEERDALIKYTSELGIDDRVIFCGFQRLLGDIYRDLDIVVLSSLNEGLPVALIEAMTAGRPIVTTNVGGVSDLVCKNMAAEVVPPKDSAAMGDAIINVLKNLDRYKEKARQCCRHTFERYNIDRLVRDIDSLYREVT
ncbi:glycosyltransferase [Thermodesulfobacteriota bacterium]